jgi:hypothetical protein
MVVPPIWAAELPDVPVICRRCGWFLAANTSFRASIILDFPVPPGPPVY